MKTLVCLLLLLAVAAPLGAANYGDITLSYGFGGFAAPDAFDLTQGDVVLSFTADMNGVTAGWAYYAQAGLSSAAMYSGFNGPPGTWGGVQMLVGSLADNAWVDSNDKFALVNANWGPQENGYNAYGPDTIGAATGVTALNASAMHRYHNLYFDRGSYTWTDITPRTISGVNVDTGGLYAVEIVYHAISPTQGTMFMSVNGEAQGFYSDSYWAANANEYDQASVLPDVQPIGKSFVGDLTSMAAYAGNYSGSDIGSITLMDFTVTQIPEPATLALLALGALALRRR